MKLFFVFLQIFAAVNAQWVKNPIEFSPGKFYDIHFTNPNIGFLCGTNGTMFRSTDQGNIWNPVSTGMTTDLFSISSRDSLLLLCGEYGTVLKSTDNGLQWQDISFSLQTTIYKIHPADDTTYFAVSENYIFRSTNAGITWVSVLNKPSVFFLDIISSGENIISAGDSAAWGIIFVSPDKGTTWQTKITTYNGSMNSLSSAAGTIYAAGLNDGIVKSTDYGNSWSQLTPVGPSIYDHESVFFISENRGWLAGRRGTIRYTQDGGLTWINQHTEGQEIQILNAIYFLNDSIGFAAGNSTSLGVNRGLLLQTSNSGVTSIKNETLLSPKNITLLQNYPNPFNPSTNIRFELQYMDFISVKVYDLLGNEIAVLFNGIAQQGKHELQFNAFGLPSGVYTYRIITERNSISSKMMLVK